MGSYEEYKVKCIERGWKAADYEDWKAYEQIKCNRKHKMSIKKEV